MKIENGIVIHDESVTRESILNIKQDVLKMAKTGEIKGFVAIAGSGRYDLDVQPLPAGVEYHDLSMYIDVAQVSEPTAAKTDPDAEKLTAEIKELKEVIAKNAATLKLYEEYADIISILKEKESKIISAASLDNEKIKARLAYIQKMVNSEE